VHARLQRINGRTFVSTWRQSVIRKIGFLLTFSFSLLACAPQSATIAPMQISAPDQILFLGDSYTIGTGVAFADSWPSQLVDRLNAQNLRVEAPRVVAQNGWTTGDLAAGIASADLDESYDSVTLLIGVNNQFRGHDIDAYQVEFRSLLAQAVQFSSGAPDKVIVLSIPDYGVTPFAANRDPQDVAAQIDAFNAVNRAEAQMAGVHYLDVTSISRQAADDSSLLAPDDLHPSPKMYAQWVDVILPLATEILSQQE
jgi:lysophospholipase L1-like esterase